MLPERNAQGYFELLFILVVRTTFIMFVRNLIVNCTHVLYFVLLIERLDFISSYRQMFFGNSIYFVWKCSTIFHVEYIILKHFSVVTRSRELTETKDVSSRTNQCWCRSRYESVIPSYHNVVISLLSEGTTCIMTSSYCHGHAVFRIWLLV